jgi:hypothetical protein
MSNYIESYVTTRRSQLPNTESAIVNDLIPEQQREDADILIRLLEDYYQHLNSKGLPSYEINRVLKESDIDSASDMFLERIQSEIAKTFPTSLKFNKVSFYKKVVQYYSARGNEDSALVFFKLFFNETAEIFYPKDQLFKLSQGTWNINSNELEDSFQGVLTKQVQLTDRDIGAVIDFVNRPSLSHESVFYINPADEDSHTRDSLYANDLSGQGNTVEFRYDTDVLTDTGSAYDSITNPYVTTRTTPDFNFSEKAYEYSNAKRKFGIITNLNYGGSTENRLPEMSAFCWVKNLHGNSATEGQYSAANWSLIDFDRSEVFNLWINPDGYLAFSGNASNESSIGTNMTVFGSSGAFDISANGKAYDHSTSAIAGSFYGKTHKYNLGDTDWHYVGVTYSSTRIILWVDGEAAQVFTPNSGTLGALGQGARRFGIIGDGSESGAGDNGSYGNPSTNRNWFTGSLAGMHLHETEICSDDSTIAAGDTNANVTANMNATRPFTMTGNEAAGTGYPTRYKAQISRYELVNSTIETATGLADVVNLENSLKAYYDFGISESYTMGSTIVSDISSYSNADSSIICDFCSHGINNIEFNPVLSQSEPRLVADRIVNRTVSGALNSTEEITLVAWVQKNDYVDAGGGDLTYSMIAKLEDYGSSSSSSSPAVYYLRGESSSGNTSGTVGYFYPLYTDESLISGAYHSHTFTGLSQVFYMPLGEINHGVANPPSSADYGNLTYQDYLGGKKIEIMLDQTDGSIGFFKAQAATTYQGLTSSKPTKIYHSTLAQFSTTNKIVDDKWHMVTMKIDGRSSGNGSVAISLDGGAFETIWSGSSSNDGAFLNWTPDENTHFTVGNAQILPVGVTSIALDATANPKSTFFPFSGLINSASIYGKQLSDSEVLALYNSTKTNVENFVVISLTGTASVSNNYKIYYSGSTHAEVTANPPAYAELEGVFGVPHLLSPTFTESISPLSGNYSNQKGHASSINKLQDSNYWQDFSYEVRSGVSSTRWRNEFLNLAHPAGLKLFAAFVLKLYKDNEWDDHYINKYYELKQQLIADPTNSAYLAAKENLEKEIQALYRLEDGANYKTDFSWIRDVSLDTAYNPTGYGIPTYQPGYLYKDFAIIQFIVEAFLTPTTNAVTEEEQHWINVGKNYIAHVVLEILHGGDNDGVLERGFDSYALGQLKFKDVTGSKQYLNYTLDKGAMNTELNLGLSDSDGTPLQELTFTALPPQVNVLGGGEILPYVRAVLSGASSSSAVTNNDYVLSNRDSGGDGTTYDNSSIDREIRNLGIRV